MAERRPLVAGLKPAEELDPELARKFVHGDKTAAEKPPAKASEGAAAEIEVDILAPDEMASLATSTIGAGGLSIRIAEVIPAGTVMDLSIKVAERKVPLLVKAQVAWSRPGELGAAFIDLFQNDRELLEGVAVKALLAQAALE